MRFIEARTPHEARPLKIAHGSDALCRDAQLSRTPPSDRRVCGAAPLVLGRLRLLADRRSVPQFASPSDRIHRDSVAGLVGSGKATSPYPGSDSSEPGNGLAVPGTRLAGAEERTRRSREANSTCPGGELAEAGERTRRACAIRLAPALRADTSLQTATALPAPPSSCKTCHFAPPRPAVACGACGACARCRGSGIGARLATYAWCAAPVRRPRTTHRPPLPPLPPPPAPAHSPLPAPPALPPLPTLPTLPRENFTIPDSSGVGQLATLLQQGI